MPGLGALASLEINHNGKDSDFAKTGKRAYAPSSIMPSHGGVALEASEPRTSDDHRDGRGQDPRDHRKYGQAALRCKRAGMKITMVHGGHGNLISQFSSPLYNKRTDDWGGSLENRARFTIAVLDRVRELCGEDYVIEFRMSADEIHPDGMHLPETLKYVELIQDKVDILHVSAGLHGEIPYMRNWWQNYTMEREYNVHYAASIKKAFPNKIVCTVGSIMDIARADEIIASGKADMVAMCRPLLADPDMPRKYALGHEDDRRPCLRCQYCGYRLMVPAVINCAVNPYLGNETEFPEGKVKKAEVKKRVAVVGGGPAGIQALLTLCDRGHDVTLYEASDHLGGSVVAASALAFKQDVRDYLGYLVHQAGKAPARVLLNTEATKELLDAEAYDALVIAVGSKPIVPAVPGIEKAHVHWAPDADSGAVQPGEKTVIVGAGSVGIESAVALKRAGHDVAVIEMASGLDNLRGSAGAAAMDLLDWVDELSIPIHLNRKLEEVTDAAVVCSDTATGERVELPADTVLLAVGMAARREVADALRRSAPETEVFVVGDATEVGSIATAVRSGFKAAAAV